MRKLGRPGAHRVTRRYRLQTWQSCLSLFSSRIRALVSAQRFCKQWWRAGSSLEDEASTSVCWASMMDTVASRPQRACNAVDCTVHPYPRPTRSTCDPTPDARIGTVPSTLSLCVAPASNCWRYNAPWPKITREHEVIALRERSRECARDDHRPPRGRADNLDVKAIERSWCDPTLGWSGQRVVGLVVRSEDLPT